VGDVAGRRVGHGRKLDPGAEVCLRQALEQVGATALGDSRAAVDDQVMLEAELVALLSLDRQGDARVALYVLDLPVARQVPAHDLVAVQANPEQLTCGDPSGFSVTRWARAADSMTARALSGRPAIRGNGGYPAAEP
jgi:hypothetical protein